MLTTNRILSQFDPWGMWNQLNSELNSQLGGLLYAPVRPSATPVNLWTRDDQAIVYAEIPGREPADIDVSVHRDILTIEVKPLAGETGNHPQPGRRERSNNGVTRQVRLPFEIDAERVEAVCEKGLLKVTLHQHASTLPAKVKVKAR